MKIFRFVPALAVLSLGVLVSVNLSFATQEISKKEKKACTTCHIANGKKDLNDTGKFYKEKKTLEGAPAKK
jgi:hypothetical protein